MAKPEDFDKIMDLTTVAVAIVANLPDLGRDHNARFRDLLRDALLANNDKALTKIRELLQNKQAETHLILTDVANLS